MAPNDSSQTKLPSEGVEGAIIEKLQTPRKFKVVLLNDDFTPMDFVVMILQRFFQKDATEAKQIMLQVHNEGKGVAGIYSHEVAEMKTMQTNQFARMHQYPLKAIMEPE
ncbi:MAG: ATP-dependent Clp protease adapter ClpS [Bdellovibrionaceae bacterium]|nr:ATP-dependent Clp protease adapter ClpS [Pseudobdellovibrionaceae bacterium]MDW8189940.1 ATP-dependent Clp protease adapter ClpS [Pseudobdellovibrionaceae bacterium]